jgi:hypothetical protein
MRALMEANYANVDAHQFEHDLAEKDWVILLFDDSAHLCGFSTLKVYDEVAGGRPVRVAYSGDTIIAPEHWGSMSLPLAFGHTLLNELDARPDLPLYWLLISKGFRTYRFLPVFFHRFVPHCDREDKELLDLMNRVASAKFGDRYDSGTGLLRAAEGAQRLSDELLDQERASERKDPHVDYFLARNPGYARGDELVCLAPFLRDNLHPFVLRQLDRSRSVVSA